MMEASFYWIFKWQKHGTTYKPETCTSPKFNMEPYKEKSPNRKVSSSWKPSFSGSMLSFGGVSNIIFAMDSHQEYHHVHGCSGPSEWLLVPHNWCCSEGFLAVIAIEHNYTCLFKLNPAKCPEKTHPWNLQFFNCPAFFASERFLFHTAGCSTPGKVSNRESRWFQFSGKLAQIIGIWTV